jgi:hypothetical protein
MIASSDCWELPAAAGLLAAPAQEHAHAYAHTHLHMHARPVAHPHTHTHPRTHALCESGWVWAVASLARKENEMGIKFRKRWLMKYKQVSEAVADEIKARFLRRSLRKLLFNIHSSAF